MEQEDNTIEKELHQTRPEVLRPVDIESRLIWCERKLQDRHMRLIVELIPDQLTRMRELEAEQEEVLDDDSSSEASEEDAQQLPFQESIEVGEKEIHVLQRDYTKELNEISERTHVRLVLTASKIKLFSKVERNIDEAMRLVTNLTMRICVQLVEKPPQFLDNGQKPERYGQLIEQSRVCEKKLGMVKVLNWKNQYFFYFDKDYIQIDEARLLIQQVLELEHYGCHLMKHPEAKEYGVFLRHLYASYATERLLKLDNRAEREELQSEISKNGRMIILHSKNLNFLREKADTYFKELNEECLQFMLKLRPDLTTEQVNAITAKTNNAKTYLTQEMTSTFDHTLVGMFISKKHLRSILSNEKHRTTFGKIFAVAFEANGNGNDKPMCLLFYIPQVSDRKKKYLDSKLAAWRMSWLSQHIIECTPKLIESGSVAALYLQALDIMLAYKEPNLEDTDLLLNSSQRTTNASFNNTSIIEDTINDSTILNSSVLNSTQSEPLVFNPNKKGAYTVWLDKQSVYGPVEEDRNYQVGKKDAQLSNKLEQLTFDRFQVRAITLNERYREQASEQPPGVRLTFVMHKSALFRNGECQLHKLKPGLGNTVSEGLLVDVAHASLTIDQERYCVIKDASLLRPTHEIVKL